MSRETVAAFMNRMIVHGLSGISDDDTYALLKLAEAGAQAMIHEDGADVLVPVFVGPEDERS